VKQEPARIFLRNFVTPTDSCASIRRLTPADLELAKILIAEVCENLPELKGEDKHRELGTMLYRALGDINPDDWPELFGRGGVRGPSYLGTAYSGARLECRRQPGASTGPGEDRGRTVANHPCSRELDYSHSRLPEGR